MTEDYGEAIVQMRKCGSCQVYESATNPQKPLMVETCEDHDI